MPELLSISIALITDESLGVLPGERIATLSPGFSEAGITIPYLALACTKTDVANMSNSKIFFITFNRLFLFFCKITKNRE